MYTVTIQCTVNRQSCYIDNSIMQTIGIHKLHIVYCQNIFGLFSFYIEYILMNLSYVVRLIDVYGSIELHIYMLYMLYICCIYAVYILYNVHCTMYTVQCTLYTVNCISNSVRCKNQVEMLK